MNVRELGISISVNGFAHECSECFFGKTGEEVVYDLGLGAGMQVQQKFLTVRPLLLFGDMWDAKQLIGSIKHEIGEYQEAIVRGDWENAQEEAADKLVFAITATMLHANMPIIHREDGTRSGLYPYEQVGIVRLMEQTAIDLHQLGVDPNEGVAQVITGKNDCHWPASRLQIPQPRPETDAELYLLAKQRVRDLRRERREMKGNFFPGRILLTDSHTAR